MTASGNEVCNGKPETVVSCPILTINMDNGKLVGAVIFRSETNIFEFKPNNSCNGRVLDGKGVERYQYLNDGMCTLTFVAVRVEFNMVYKKITCCKLQSSSGVHSNSEFYKTLTRHFLKY